MMKFFDLGLWQKERAPRRGLAAGALATVLVAGLLAGCSADESIPPENTASARPTVSALAPQSSQPPASSAQSPESEGPYAGLSPALPGGNYAPVADAAALTGSWFHMVDEYVRGAENWVYQFRFEEVPGEMMISYGLMDSGAGVFFRGPYTLGQDGTHSATLKLSDFEVPDDTPEIQITFKAEKPEGEDDLLVLTLASVNTQSEEFNAAFKALVGQPVAYARYA